MTGYDFNFEGKEYLTKIGASWFVSYSYYKYIDHSHTAWQKCSTTDFRIKIFEKTETYHNMWWQQIIFMNEQRLSTNKLELNGKEIKNMALKLIHNKQVENVIAKPERDVKKNNTKYNEDDKEYYLYFAGVILIIIIYCIFYYM